MRNAGAVGPGRARQCWWACTCMRSVCCASTPREYAAGLCMRQARCRPLSNLTARLVYSRGWGVGEGECSVAGGGARYEFTTSLRARQRCRYEFRLGMAVRRSCRTLTRSEPWPCLLRGPCQLWPMQGPRPPFCKHDPVRCS